MQPRRVVFMGATIFPIVAPIPSGFSSMVIIVDGNHEGVSMRRRACEGGDKAALFDDDDLLAVWDRRYEARSLKNDHQIVDR
jgi:hypothetical protein